MNLDAATRARITALLITNALAPMAAFPQYTPAMFEGFGLGIATKATKTKAGIAVVPNEMVLFRANELDVRYVTIWSVSNRCLTSVKASSIVAVA